MRGLISAAVALILVAPSALEGGSRFVQPLEAAQVHGPTLLEIESDTAGINRVSFFIDGALVGVVREAPWRFVHDFGDSMGEREVEASIHSDSFRVTEKVSIRTTGLTVNDSMNVDVVELSVRASSRNGHLSPRDLTVVENGRIQELLALNPSRGPMAFTFVVDQSLSMGDGKLASALAAVQHQLVQLRNGDTASLVLFNHRVSPARDLLRGTLTIDNVSPSGGTSLRDALASLDPSRAAAVIVITDGADRNSATSTESALQAISRNRITVYGIALGGGEGSTFLRDAAERTGGSFVRVSKDSIERVLSSIVADINSRYTLAYQSTNLDPGWRQVTIAPANRDVSVQIRTRRYFAE